MIADGADGRIEDPTLASDVGLIAGTRAGDDSCFAELWRRHYAAAVAAARATTSRFDADDLAQEAFASILTAIRTGGGPRISFRAYVLTTVRNTAVTWSRECREYPEEDLERRIEPAWEAAHGDGALNHSLTCRAFESLPARWQEVLWYVEVERMKLIDVATLLGMTANAVAQLAFRAREGLREAWVQAHLRALTADSECHWVVSRLGSHVRGNASRRDSERIGTHLDTCSRCATVAAEAVDVHSRLTWVLLPVVLGAGAAGYAAWSLSGNTTAAVASAGVHAPLPTRAVRISASTPTTGSTTAAHGGITGIAALGAKIAAVAAAFAIIGTAGSVTPAGPERGEAHTVASVQTTQPPWHTASRRSPAPSADATLAPPTPAAPPPPARVQTRDVSPAQPVHMARTAPHPTSEPPQAEAGAPSDPSAAQALAGAPSRASTAASSPASPASAATAEPAPAPATAPVPPTTAGTDPTYTSVRIRYDVRISGAGSLNQVQVLVNGVPAPGTVTRSGDTTTFVVNVPTP